MRTSDAGRAPQDGGMRRGDAEPGPARAFGGREALHEVLRKEEGAEEAARPRRRYRSWKKKSDDEIVAIAQEAIERGSVGCKSRLWEVDAGLADRLRERGLWGRVRFRGSAEGNGKAAADEGAGCARISHEGEGAGRPAVTWSAEEVMFLAQSAIDEMGIADLPELERLDPELHGLVAGADVGGRLRFGACVAGEEKDGPAGPGGPQAALKEERSPLLALGAEQLRKSGLGGMALGEEEMFRLILAECFRMGTGNPYLGSMRSTVPKLQSNMNRKLNRSQHRVFKRCWARMEAEGVIAYNSNRSAASLDFSRRGSRDDSLGHALAWGVSEQMKVGPEWRGRFGLSDT